MRKNLSKATRGFTIVEVMIALAIGGLIIAIVFGAIPTLQRTNRNDSRKQDVAALLSATSHYGLNHSANFPTAPSDILPFVHLAYYDPSQVFVMPQRPGATARLSTNNSETVTLYNYYRCASNGTAVSQGADDRNVVAIYALETGGNSTTSQCQQL